MKVFNVVGTRPNFIKIAPLMEEMRKHSLLKPVLIHTGQHYDEKMSDSFFRDLDIPNPDINLEVGSGSHAEQTAAVMIAFEKLCVKEKPDLVLVVGDVNSTLACSIVAAKLCIPVAHVESGLRSKDRKMPEEINRIITDALSTYLFTTSRDADENLIREGIDPSKIFFVGNVMIDTLLKYRAKTEKSRIHESMALYSSGTIVPYIYVTLHRPSNVDDRKVLTGILEALETIQKDIRIVFSVHPRTRKQIDNFKLSELVTRIKNLTITEPLNYLDSLALMEKATLVMTDSGGVQEETTVLNIPCLTLRENTERPVTITVGTNVLVGTQKELIVSEAQKILSGEFKSGNIPELWDGTSAQRIVEVLLEHPTKLIS